MGLVPSQRRTLSATLWSDLLKISPDAQAFDQPSLDRHFGGGEGLLPLWIAEPYLDLAPQITEGLVSRATTGWYGYQTRSAALSENFWAWMQQRHQWDGHGLQTLVSPSVGSSLGILLEQMTQPGDNVILQPPVFTDFKTLVNSAQRTVVRNGLLFENGQYEMDFTGLETLAAQPATTALILCNPHNPVSRVWNQEELHQLAAICASHQVTVIADEIHADLILDPHSFTPFAQAAQGTGVRWAVLHGPIKTFGLAGLCDTLVITDDSEIVERFEHRSSQLHLTRNNVFALTAFETAYAHGGPWLDQLLGLMAGNVGILKETLPPEITLVELQGTYLAWLDFRDLNMEVPALAHWLGHTARLALSPGHWFGREGAGFARMTIAAPAEQIQDAAERLSRAVAQR